MVAAMQQPATSQGPVSLPFEKFWAWACAHQNCILRAGTPDVLLFDHDDYHWHFAVEDERTHVVQLARGKELVGELVMLVDDIAYVHCELSENDEFICECIVETENRRDAAYHFVMIHGYEEEAETPGPRRWTH